MGTVQYIRAKTDFFLVSRLCAARMYRLCGAARNSAPEIPASRQSVLLLYRKIHARLQNKKKSAERALTPFVVFAVFPNEDRFILFLINVKGDIPRIKTKKRAFLLSFLW